MAYEGIHKAKKGLIRVRLSLDPNKIIKNIEISGDFFLYPEDALWIIEKHLVGKKAEKNELLAEIKKIYLKHNIETPFLNPEDFVKAILNAVRKYEEDTCNIL
ncbi:MAG: lipoate--protein ligase family protein [Thermoprotei archaeon]|nr:MAG: lipoate--protein ligase family protein [Thermoprotei archaeon]